MKKRKDREKKDAKVPVFSRFAGGCRLVSEYTIVSPEMCSDTGKRVTVSVLPFGGGLMNLGMFYAKYSDKSVYSRTTGLAKEKPANEISALFTGTCAAPGEQWQE